MNLLHSLLLIIFFPVITHSQVQDSLLYRELTPPQMQEDLNTYSDLLLETHPGIFRYLQKERYQEIIHDIESEIKEPLPFYSYYRLLAKLAAQIKCAHTHVFPVQDMNKFIQESSNLFPFFMYPINEKLYVLFNGTEDQTILPGFELISINQKPVTEIINTIRKFQSFDGNPENVPRRYLQGGYFSFNHYLFVDPSSSYEVIFKDLDGNLIEFTAPGQPYKTSDKNYFGNPANKKMLSAWNNKHKNWHFEILDEVSSTALIRFGSFGGKGMYSEDRAQEAMQTFMNKSLSKMRKKGISNLIIELRGNGGGWDIQGKELFSYLMTSDTAQLYYLNKFASTTDSKFLEYSDISAEQLERAISYLIPQDNGSYKLDVEGNSILLPQEPKENRFRGRVYILFEEQCSSSCAEFTAIAKSNKVGTLVGNESGGAYGGGNGSSFINFILPNSGIYSETPLVKYQMAVGPSQPLDRGTIPDYTVNLTLEDLLNGYDSQRICL